MPGLLLGDIVELRLKATLQGQEVENVLHYQCTTPGTESISVLNDLGNLLNTIDATPASIYNTWRVCIPVTNVILAGEMQKIQPTRSVAVGHVWANVVGGRGATSTSNLSAVVTKGTDFGGRGQTGSVHLPGVADGDQVTGELIAALQTLLAAFGAAMKSTITDAVTGVIISPIIYHPPVKADPEHVPPTPAKPYGSTPLTRYKVQETIRVMRRRTIGVGR